MCIRDRDPIIQNLTGSLFSVNIGYIIYAVTYYLAVEVTPIIIISMIIKPERTTRLENDTLDDFDRDNLEELDYAHMHDSCLLYTSPSPRDRQKSRMPSSA
eukprot:TRINITY_DN18877_c0_g1_i1.p1 TRINITY_DN18877_c0_g1~~TRINITY_DN18877_c0_g1_i1.p1  ORF type:complete len:101 (-),score=17.96 TRINITY_DN18877_c0_g1_i1:10-312(-)